jgi:hypothetical protein
MLKPGVYKHYKGKHGGEYLVTGVAMHENTGEEVVVYKALYGNRKLFVRPLEQFLEIVEWNGKAEPRFRYLREME